MLALKSYPVQKEQDLNPTAEVIGRKLRLVANNLKIAREEEAREALEKIVKSRSEVIQEARRVLLDNLVKAAETLVGFLELKRLAPGEYRAARLKLKVAINILEIHGF